MKKTNKKIEVEKQETFTEDLHKALYIGDKDSSSVKKIIAISKLTDVKMNKEKNVDLEESIKNKLNLQLRKIEQNKLLKKINLNNKKSVKKSTIKNKINNWINKTFLERYLVSFDKRLVDLLSDYKRKIINRKEEHAQRIIKILNSKEYKDYFFKAIKYDKYFNKFKVKPFGNSTKDKILSFIAEKYIYFFRKDMYINIQRLRTLKNDMKAQEFIINEYMANTTVEERLDRAANYGIIKSSAAKAQKRMRKIQTMRVNKIKELNADTTLIKIEG